MDPGYPRHIERWRGVPENIDAATTWKGGYFFNISINIIILFKTGLTDKRTRFG